MVRRGGYTSGVTAGPGGGSGPPKSLRHLLGGGLDPPRAFATSWGGVWTPQELAPPPGGGVRLTSDVHPPAGPSPTALAEGKPVLQTFMYNRTGIMLLLLTHTTSPDSLS